MIMWYRLGSQITPNPKSKEITGSRAVSTQMGTWGFFLGFRLGIWNGAERAMRSS
jgi:hypothetical protein